VVSSRGCRRSRVTSAPIGLAPLTLVDPAVLTWMVVR
jgi:hypothetical protein